MPVKELTGAEKEANDAKKISSKEIYSTIGKFPLHPINIMRDFHVKFDNVYDNIISVISDFLGPCSVSELLKRDNGDDSEFWNFALLYMLGKDEAAVQRTLNRYEKEKYNVNGKFSAKEYMKGKFDGKLCHLCDLNVSQITIDYYKDKPEICLDCFDKKKDFKIQNILSVGRNFLIPEEKVESLKTNHGISCATRFYTMDAVTTKQIEEVVNEVHGTMANLSLKLKEKKENEENSTTTTTTSST